MKNALIFGGTSGIGKAVAIRLAKLKWQVLVLGRRKERLDELVASYSNISAGICDVTDRQSVKSAINGAMGMGPISAVLLASGAGFEPDVPIERASESIWQEAINTNIMGARYVVENIKPLLASSDGCVFAAIGSRAAIIGDVLPGRVAYSATKHGQSAIVETLRQELKQEKANAYVFMINPGYVPGTEMVANYKTSSLGTPLDRAAELICKVLTDPEKFREHFSLLLENKQLYAMSLLSKPLSI